MNLVCRCNRHLIAIPFHPLYKLAGIWLQRNRIPVFLDHHILEIIEDLLRSLRDVKLFFDEVRRLNECHRRHLMVKLHVRMDAVPADIFHIQCPPHRHTVNQCSIHIEKHALFTL